LNQDEFAVAMHLIYRRLNGYDIPATLPPELIPPSSRELNESLDKIKSILNSDAHNTQTLLNSQPGAQYVKSRSFTSTPTVEYNDAVVYKHKDDDVGYVSAARHRVPSVPRDRSPSYSSLSTSLSEYGDRDDLSGKLSRLKKEIHEKQILLEALSYSAKSGPTSYDRSYSSNSSDIDDYKFKIKELHRKIVDLQNSTPEWLSREFVKNKDELNSLMDQHRNLDYEFNNMLSSIVPDLIHKVRETNSKVATAKLELFKIRDERDGGSKIIGTGPGGSITEADKIKAKAQAMLQDRMARMTGKSHNFGSGISDSSSSRRYDDEMAKVNSEKEIKEREVTDIERNISRLQDSLIRIVKEREEIEDKLRQIEINTQSYESDTRKWEDGIGVGEEVRRFIDDLKRDAPKSSYRTEYTQNNYSYDGIKYNESRYSSTGNDSYDHSRPISSSSYSSVSSVSSSVQSSNAKTPGERSAFIEAEAKRRMQERLKALGIDNPAPAPTSPSDSSTITDRLIRERADTAERLERAEREAAERERIREQKLLAEKQKKAELEADRLRKLEEFKRQEEERKNKWLTEAQELEKAKDKKLRDKEEASRAMELELERRRLEEIEREKRQQEERLARIKREEEERAAAEERYRLEQEALIENSRAARELAKKREEETKQREEALKRDIGKSSKVKKEISVSREVQDEDWNVINKNEDSSDDDFTVPPVAPPAPPSNAPPMP
ncbi:12940_t:CDS:1, partial [Gigaspora rosea]